MKLAVFFPGIGYHCDKPLLYYSSKIASQYQYELCKVTYTNLSKVTYTDLSKVIDAVFEDAMEQTEACLDEVKWNEYEDILFVSKSIGTVTAAAYAGRHNIKCRNIYYTPVEQTFLSGPRSGIAFHGTGDPWAHTPLIQSKCQENNLPLHIIEGVNHSLEAKGDTQKNIRILQGVMELSEAYIAGVEPRGTVL